MEAYQAPGFRYRPFDEYMSYRWVWGHSFARAEPILVPDAYAYYGTRDKDSFAYEISNGCALGSCLEEAILYGILEVAERDAFLMTWYARMSVPRIEPDSARDRAIPTLVNTIEAETGYRVLIFDTTLEQGIPCFWVMAVSATGSDEQPKVVCAAGSHLDPERAVENALSELGPVLANFISTFPGQRERARQMVADPLLVRSMEDHSLVNADVSAFDRFDFLTESAQVRSLADISSPAGYRHADLRPDLGAVIDRYRDTGLDVIVVDQTTPEHRAGGLSCGKVIIPGTLPMTFVPGESTACPACTKYPACSGTGRSGSTRGMSTHTRIRFHRASARTGGGGTQRFHVSRTASAKADRWPAPCRQSH